MHPYSSPYITHYSSFQGVPDQAAQEVVSRKGHAVAEKHVKWLKCRARALLQDAQLDKSFWPCAMKHACLLHKKRIMGQQLPKVRFGSRVWV